MNLSPNEKNDDKEVIYLSQLPEMVQHDILAMLEYIISANDLLDENYDQYDENSECN